MSLILHDQVKVTQGGNHCTIFLVLLYVAWRFMQYSMHSFKEKQEFFVTKIL